MAIKWHEKVTSFRLQISTELILIFIVVKKKKKKAQTMILPIKNYKL